MSLPEGAARLLADAGLARPGEPTVCTPLDGGRNNRVFKVEAGARRALLKSYFHHPSDPRDRLGAELGFARYAWGQGIRALPEPLGGDAAHHLGLYAYVEGRKLGRAEVGADEIDAAVDFMRALQRGRESAAAQALGDASEACFTLGAHLETVDRRLKRLEQVGAEEPVERAAQRFVQGELGERWRELRARVCADAARWGFDMNSPLTAEERCLSPSDFGFHNAVVGPEGKLAFLDFEYAGWDDPAKLACDFFCQVERPVDRREWPRFIAALDELLPPSLRLAERAKLLLPVCETKWCIILLNEFLPVDGERRAFAGPAHRQEARRRAQLELARACLARTGRMTWPTSIF